MQIWIFFFAGTGGDGFTNLLEQSLNVVPIDGESGYWRIHRVVDNQMKFYAPSIDKKSCFRFNLPFKQHDNSLRKTYIDIIEKQQNCVIASHDVNLTLLQNSDQLEVLTFNQIKIALVCQNFELMEKNNAIKNLRPKPNPVLPFYPDSKQFDFIVDIEEIQNDWQHVQWLCSQIGFDLSRDKYHQYQSLLQGQFTYMTSNHDIEIYKSYQKKDLFYYDLIAIHQPTHKKNA